MSRHDVWMVGVGMILGAGVFVAGMLFIQIFLG
jgi:hypothetical protein